MRNLCGLIGFILSLSAAAQVPGLAPESNWDLGGYAKYMATVNVPDSGSDNVVDHLVHQRFNFEYRFNSQWRANVSMRNRLLWGDSVSRAPNYADLIGKDSGYIDLTTNWLEKGKVIGTTQFDRAYVNWNQDSWYARVGRFRVNWAMTTLWNPNDIYNTYSIYDFDYEEKGGTDAILIGKNLGFASGVDIVFSPGKSDESNSYSIRYLGNESGWDYQVMAGKSKTDRVIGAGFAGDVKGAGLKGEISYFKPDENQIIKIELKNSVIASLESDYSFGGTQNWLGRIAALYISQPQEVDNAIKFLNMPLTARTMSFSRFTGYADLGFDVSPLLRATLSSTIYSDGSIFYGGNASYSLSDNTQLIGVIQRFDGRSNSVFGKSPGTAFYAQVKWSF
ncbi:hypothetical protein [Vibrio nigripulchritudo]|uniref:hypothetical protein n=1 Tax=Vibrio nigripulchritudo TaxID=28173 RepID=UPI0005FA67F2|nr:hypothetical protein [Vibrio nigripulchritudo]KJY79768.1 hypothetical protein TW74_08230 [Vibrio nigripulchritudo]